MVPLAGDWVQYFTNFGPTTLIPWNATHVKYGKGKGYSMTPPEGMNSAYGDGSARWASYQAEELSAGLQWETDWIRYWGIPRVQEKPGYGL